MEPCDRTLLALVALAGCGGGPRPSGRPDRLLRARGGAGRAALRAVREADGIDVEVRYGDSAELAATIAEEGDNTPADVFFSQDAGALGSVDASSPSCRERRARARPRALPRRPQGAGSARPAARAWSPTTPRAVPRRPARLDLRLDRARVEGQDRVPPTNASFQAFVTAMRLTPATSGRASGSRPSRPTTPKTYENNTPIEEAIAAVRSTSASSTTTTSTSSSRRKARCPGRATTSCPATTRARSSTPPAPAILESSDKPEARAVRRVPAVDRGQRFYAERRRRPSTRSSRGRARRRARPARLRSRARTSSSRTFGAELEDTLEMLNEVGWTT